MDYIDQTGHKITLTVTPTRIISLVPSQTELLYYLDILPIGQTIFCVHPSDKYAKSTKIGGTKKLQLDKIKRLNPDLIIGNKEENQKEQIEELRKTCNVWLSDIHTISDSNNMISSIGDLVNRQDTAQKLINQISIGFKNVLQSNTTISVLYLIWRKPYMAAGRDTFIQDVLHHCGYLNSIEQEDSRYPELTNEQIATLNPMEVLLSSEPYPFKDEHMQELQKTLPEAKISLVDGELFSWYGPRLLKTIRYLNAKKSSL
ncbi:MAG: cobalamin-binding protein [Bacteroidetes bacterium]|nr:MAG: cobalamin-binding protein [Bacteroidota bacterium]